MYIKKVKEKSRTEDRTLFSLLDERRKCFIPCETKKNVCPFRTNLKLHTIYIKFAAEVSQACSDISARSNL